MTDHCDHCWEHRRLGPNYEREMEWNAQRLAAIEKFVEDIKRMEKEAEQMGQFKIEITAVGGHGCQREVKDGGTVYGCGYQSCPDCRIREFLADFARRYDVRSATFTHWPGEPSEVVDDLMTKIRKGSFER